MKYIRGDITVVRVMLPNPKGDLLFVQRNHDSEYNADLWELPGGKLITTDEDPDGIAEDHIEGAVDRVRKGTGLIIKMSTNLLLVEKRKMRDPARCGQVYVCLAGTGDVIGGELSLGPSYQASEYINPAPPKPYEYTTDTIRIIALNNQKLFHL